MPFIKHKKTDKKKHRATITGQIAELAIVDIYSAIQFLIKF